MAFLQAWFGTDAMSATEIIDDPFAVFVIAVVTQAGAAFLGDRLRKKSNRLKRTNKTIWTRSSPPR
jgi:hypothetical protein